MTKKVTVYSKPDCMQCMYTRKYLTEHHIDFNTIDVTKDEFALRLVKEQLGYQAVPVVVVIGGDDIGHWYGFQPDKLAKLVE